MKIIAYDLEIKKAIPPKDGVKLDGVEYCEGWHDHANMGVSVLCTADIDTQQQEVFYDTVSDTERLTELFNSANLIVGFNNIRFDDKVLMAAWDFNANAYTQDDLLEALWKNAGLDPDQFYWQTHGGYGLDAVCKANGLKGKVGYGGTAPIDFQNGKIGRLTTYCLDDALKTAKLYRLYLDGKLCCPKTGKTVKPR